jgi:TrmH family RNA methyltransferase
VGATGAFHPKAIRTSMGSLFRMKVLEYATLEPLVQALRAAGIRTLGAVSRNGTPLPELGARTGPLAVVFGSEAFGLSAEECRQLDELVTIPMRTGVDSFSVNAAAAMFLYELQRLEGPG